MSETVKSIPTLSMLRMRSQEIHALAAKHGAYNVRVFGSVARGEATPTSDIDLLVEFREGTSLYDLSALRLDLAELLGYPVDVISDHPRLNAAFRQHLLRESLVI